MMAAIKKHLIIPAMVLLAVALVSCSLNTGPVKKSNTASASVARDAEASSNKSGSQVATDYAAYRINYAPVLSVYRKFVLNGPDQEDTTWGEPWDGMSEDLHSAKMLDYNLKTYYGYALKDLNGDGTPELILLSRYPSGEDLEIQAIYTLANNQPQLLITSYYRHPCVISADGTIYSSASGGAADNSSTYYKIAPDNKSLLPVLEIGTEVSSSDEIRYFRKDGTSQKKYISKSEYEAIPFVFPNAPMTEASVGLKFTSLW